MSKMEEVFKYARFEIEPLNEETYVKGLRECLKEVPATVTTKDLEVSVETNGEQEVAESSTGSTPLHLICASVEVKDAKAVEVARAMVDVLLEYGANWMMLDDNNETPGCIALRRKVPSEIYDRIVAAGVRSEVFLRRMTEEVDVVDNDELKGDAAGDQEAYLASDLEYSGGNLTTKEGKDGVMMDWETPIMKRSAEIMVESAEDETQLAVLNVGFGMGIIDTFLQAHAPRQHYICEAHPDVLKKLRQDGWYDKPGVVVLEGRWQDSIPQLIADGIQLDGIYYDTFSEHYQDMIDFFDYVVALLKPQGTFSFFNGLGADRQVCYDVYCQVVEVDLAEYGLAVTYEELPIESSSAAAASSAPDWTGIRRPYWTLSTYILPICRFLGA